MSESQAALFLRLSAYAQQFEADFRRRDQARWLGIYLCGLISATERKKLETLKCQAHWPDRMRVEDPAQALQNFLNQSPWDERKLLCRYRQHMAQHFGVTDGTFVIHEVAFPKQGRRSVGVLRQYCPEMGHKVNCQIAVAISYVSSSGSCPLGMRLYLPRSWLSDPLRLESAGVPPEHRLGLTKPQIAMELIKEILADGMPGEHVLAVGAYGGSPEVRRQLDELGMSYLLGVNEDHQVACADSIHRPEHFPRGIPGGRLPVRDLAQQLYRSSSGHRAWLPVWPDVQPDGSPIPGTRSVGLLVQQQGRHFTYALGKLLKEATSEAAVQFWRRGREAEVLSARLRKELGLGHFEGRSWRGFHHHASLVLLAFGFKANPAFPPEGRSAVRCS